MITFRNATAAAFLFLCGWIKPAAAEPVLWPSAEGGNDHYYDIDLTSRSLADARVAAATAEPPEGYGEGHVVTITSAAEQAFLAAEFPPLETCAPFNGPCIWIDLSDEQSEGNFVWLDGPEAGLSLQQIGYSNWAAGEPNNSSNEDCAIYGWNATTGWNDVGCAGPNVSIIEWEPVVAPKLVLWPSSEGGNDHYYYLDVVARTFAEARTAASMNELPAQGYGEGHVVTITSAEEQAFLAEEFPPLETCRPFQGPCIWIAASDAETEGQFQWLDGPEAGSTFWPEGGYSNWFPAEPNNSAEEDCVVYGWTDTAQWNDVSCGGTSMSLVEWEFATTTTTTTIPLDTCGDAVPPAGVTASDALYVLRSAVGSAQCEPCVCDVDDSGTLTATDSLRTLRNAVGQNVQLQCPSCD
ncbi:MAG TPA: C-type lectin domain-containing protein [Candidatus Binatia bacterium]|nr:C-type lectin domain-containing protein [Candidatus Binatia bacterium]